MWICGEKRYRVYREAHRKRLQTTTFCLDVRLFQRCRPYTGVEGRLCVIHKAAARNGCVCRLGRDGGESDSFRACPSRLGPDPLKVLFNDPTESNAQPLASVKAAYGRAPLILVNPALRSGQGCDRRNSDAAYCSTGC